MNNQLIFNVLLSVFVLALVYVAFLILDKDGDGRITKEEFAIFEELDTVFNHILKTFINKSKYDKIIIDIFELSKVFYEKSIDFKEDDVEFITVVGNYFEDNFNLSLKDEDVILILKNIFKVMEMINKRGK